MVHRARQHAADSNHDRWYRSSFWPSLGSGLLVWAAFPPLGLSLLAWLAPIGWLHLIRVEKMRGRRPYAAVWLGGLVHWLAMLAGITYAHPLNILGWLALCSYLAGYLPLFVALSRLAVHRLRIPLIAAAPVVWTGLELLRGHLLTGFSIGLLGHTQFERTALIQICDLTGAYGVSFLVVLVASCLTTATAMGRGAVRSRALFDVRQGTLAPLVIAAAAVVAAIGYGYPAPRSPAPAGAQPLKVALIQETFNTRFEFDPERNDQTFLAYHERALEARRRHPDLDLIVWPESVFTGNLPEVMLRGPVEETADLSADQLAQLPEFFRMKTEYTAAMVNQLAEGSELRTLDIWLLLGTETRVLGGGGSRQHNTALLIDADGEVVCRYYKMHPVMFGEYIPLGNTFPWIYDLTPMAQGLTPGDRPESFEVQGVRLAPSICFESSVPHLIRRQVVRLTREGRSPDALVNITHDGWFWGSAILELQLACAVFRAVELRRPFLVAANAGISAWIDENGRILQRGPRQGPATLIALLRRTNRSSVYTRYGDVFAGGCLIGCLLLSVTAVMTRRAKRRPRDQE